MREFDLIVFGATGFTGRLVAEALLEFPEPDLRWAIAGRNEAKLRAVRGELAERFPGAERVPVVVADVTDADSMAAMAARTRVVCSTVGPYTRYGDATVNACVSNGTDYCDITGEVNWMRSVIDAHHENAVQRQCRIVHAAGFDSVPFDLGVYVLQQAAVERWGAPATTVRTATGRMKGGLSGGTLASMMLIMDSVRRDRRVLRQLANPYVLVPGGTGPDKNEHQRVEHWPEHGVWTGPFIMAGCNTRVVRRSHALLGAPWGEDFSYTEAMGTGRGVRGWVRAQVMRAGLGAMVVILATPLLRALALGRWLPIPGDGPTLHQRTTGHFAAHVVGSRGDRTIAVDVTGEGDPGYLATSRMLAQTALALATDALPPRYGVLTPASVLGEALPPRLERVGIRFTVRSA